MSELRSRAMTSESHAARSKRLVQLILELKERQCLSEIEGMLSAGWDPMDLLECCVQGMRLVGKRFEEGRYFIAALIMASAIMRQATALISPHLAGKKSSEAAGTILLGTIAGDIHDLGKNLFAILARCDGFEVLDLGVDVSPQTFATESEIIRPDLIGISCLLTSSLPELKTAVQMLQVEPSPLRPPVIIGGTCVDEQISRYVQADYWVHDGAQGLKICRQVIHHKGSASPTLQQR